MAKMVGAWIDVAPRSPSDNVNMTVGGTILMTQEDIRRLGNSLMRVKIRIMDHDTVTSDDHIHTDTNFSFGPRSVGPNCFHTGFVVPRSEVEASEFWDSEAEVYALVSAAGGGLTTNEAKSTPNLEVVYD
jgi:hypothetical protein